MTLNVYLIRHAETDFNKKNSGFFQSDKIKLNPYGKIQLKALSEKLSKINFDTIYSSDLIRAKETTENIFRKQSKKVILDKRLREYVHGKFSPDSEEWKKKYDKLLKSGIPREEIRPFGGENIWDLIKRSKSFLKDLEKQSGNIAIISHSGANEILINLSQGRKKEDFLKIKQDNACINRLIYNNGKWEILIVNDTTHLESLKPSVELYENISDLNEKILEVLKKEDILNSEDIYAIGDLAKGRIGKYKRTFRKYFGTPMELVVDVLNNKIKNSWKIIHILKDMAEYEIGEIYLEGIKHKINIIIPKDYKKFISKSNIKKIL